MAIQKSAKREPFEALYRALNRPEFIHPDPLVFVRRFEEEADQEVAGLISSGLAFGRVGHIMASLEKVFTHLPEPARMVDTVQCKEFERMFRGFGHRWTNGREVAALLHGAGQVRREWGSLEKCFAEGLMEGDGTVVPASVNFVSILREAGGEAKSSLLSCPSGMSACKRLFLYLRWMVRRDDVDPGPWRSVPASLLVVPVDTHMHRVALALGITKRRQADLKCALEITEFFRQMAPGDPARYDFSLTRAGIRGDDSTRSATEAVFAC